MKFQVQFAGIDFNRPVPPRRRRARKYILAGAFVLAGLSYSYYLYHVAHIPIKVISHAAAALPATASLKPVVIEPSAKLPPALRQATEAGVTTLFARVVEAVKIPAIPTVAPQSPTIAVNPAPAQPVAVPVSTVAAPVTYVVTTPKVYKTRPPATPQQRLQRAAQTALDNMLNQASKYPDAYGFGPEDIFQEAKLGEAIPVYTIAETDRARYKVGQPVKPLLKPANQWVFPVLAGNRICCMIQVQYTGREYVPGSSSKALAMAWTKITDKWQAEDGYHPQLVMNPEVPGYYFTIPELPTPNMTDTIQMFYYHPALSPAEVILASWR